MSNAVATKTISCPKCSGTGTLRAFMHIENGKCYLCGGSKTVELKAASTKARASNRKFYAVAVGPEECTDLTHDHPCVSFHSDDLTEIRNYIRVQNAANNSWREGCLVYVWAGEAIIAVGEFTATKIEFFS